jgi:hypothetical protein
MKLKDFPFLTGDDRAKYSCLVTLAIYAAHKYEIIPDYSVNERKGIGDNEDRLEYWDTTTTISFGRYLVYDPDGKNIKFWLGLYRDACNKPPQFIIWFKRVHVRSYISALQNIPNFHNKPSDLEVWVPLDPLVDDVFKDFYNENNSCEAWSKAIEDFLDRVLRELK